MFAGHSQIWALRKAWGGINRCSVQLVRDLEGAAIVVVVLRRAGDGVRVRIIRIGEAQIEPRRAVGDEKRLLIACCVARKTIADEECLVEEWR